MDSEKMIYYYIWFFMVYSFLGWCIEVIFATTKSRKFTNRGFLNGPLCPIYGFGLIIILIFVGPYKDNILKLFLYSTVLISALEYIVGFTLEKLFYHKWWDYSEMKYNIGGYISLYFSMLWGIGCILVMKFIHPIVEIIVTKIPLFIGYPVVLIFVVYLMIDTYVTVLTINGLNRRLSRLEEIANKLKDTSDGLGESLYERTINVLDKQEEFKVKVENRRAIRTDLLNEEEEILKQKKITQSRLIKAFPKMKSKKFSNALTKLQEYIDKS